MRNTNKEGRDDIEQVNELEPWKSQEKIQNMDMWRTRESEMLNYGRKEKIIVIRIYILQFNWLKHAGFVIKLRKKINNRKPRVQP